MLFSLQPDTDEHIGVKNPTQDHMDTMAVEPGGRWPYYQLSHGHSQESCTLIVPRCKMQLGIVYIEHPDQSNICTEYGLLVRKSKWEITPKVVENDRAKMLLDFQL